MIKDAMTMIKIRNELLMLSLKVKSYEVKDSGSTFENTFYKEQIQFSYMLADCKKLIDF